MLAMRCHRHRIRSHLHGSRRQLHAIGREIVRSRPPDYFDAANRLFLEMLCCHIVSADRIWAEIHECDPNDPKQFRRYRSLLVMASRESRMTSLLLTKLRLLPSKTAAAAAEVTPVRPPWERYV